MGVRTGYQKGNAPIDLYIGTAYDDVAIVAKNIDAILAITQGIDYLTNYLGASTSPPTSRLDGSPLENGDYYYNSDLNALVYYDLPENLWYEVDPSDVYNAKDQAIAAATEAQDASNSAISAKDEATIAKNESEAQADRAKNEADRAESAAAGGIEEAPVNGKTYGRKDADWIEVDLEGGIEEAPEDDKEYTRKNAAWEELIIPESGIVVDTTPPQDSVSLHPNDSFDSGLDDWDTGSAMNPTVTNGDLYLSAPNLIKLSNFDVGEVSNGDTVRLSIDVKEVTNFSPSFLCADGSNVPDISEYIGVAVVGKLFKDVIVTDADIFLPKLKCGYEGSITIAYFKAEKLGQPNKATSVIYNESSNSYSTAYTPTEAPEDGKQYARKDADWVEVEGGGSMSEFKMQDATDAELNQVPTIIPPQGLQWAFGSSNLAGQYQRSTEAGKTWINCNPEDGNGTITNLIELDGHVANVLSELHGSFLNVTLIAKEYYGSVVLIRFEGMPSMVSGTVTILNGGEPTLIPLKEGDAWVFNEAEQKFKPKPVALKSDIPIVAQWEDATEGTIYGDNLIYDNGGNTGGLVRTTTVGNKATLYEIDYSGYAESAGSYDVGAEFGISIGDTYNSEGLESDLSVGFFLSVTGSSYINSKYPTDLGQNGTDNLGTGTLYANDLIGFLVNLSDNTVKVFINGDLKGTIDVSGIPEDVRVYANSGGNGFTGNVRLRVNESKNKSYTYGGFLTPSVPTVVVTEFPAEPDANTLYIKVV